MASTINASSTGSGGLISTGDASGTLELQANGTTKLSVASTGVSITGGIASPLEVTGNSTAGAEIRLPEDTDNGSNYVALKAADSIASNVTFTLPAADGTSGQVLQTNGSGTLSFATPAGGSWTYLSTVTASNSATVDVETTLDSTYATYAFVISGFVPQNDNRALRARFKIGGSYASANYQSSSAESSSLSATINVSSGTGAIETIQDVGNASGENCSAVMYISNPSSTSLMKLLYGIGSSMGAGGGSSVCFFSGLNTSLSAVTGVQFFFNTGNIVSGSVRLYGIKNS